MSKIIKVPTGQVLISYPFSHEIHDLTKPMGKYRVYQGAVAQLRTEALGTYAYAVSSLSNEGFKLPTYQQALKIVDRSKEVKQEVEGKWFWLAGHELDFSGYHTFDGWYDLSALVGVTEVEQIREPEKTVRCYSGTGYQLLAVVDDRNLRVGRFHLRADAEMQDYKAPLIVGIPRWGI